MADKAGYRLSKRFYRLIRNGKMPCQAVVAVARELAGFIWALLQTDQRCQLTVPERKKNFYHPSSEGGQKCSV